MPFYLFVPFYFVKDENDPNKQKQQLLFNSICMHVLLPSLQHAFLFYFITNTEALGTVLGRGKLVCGLT